jgi:membrane-associated HD superfamily phosphohydrolase
MKRWFKIYFSVLFYPVLYLPYKFVNYILIVKMLGCPCTNPNFNTNNITDIFWLLIGIITILFFIVNYLKNYNLKCKKNILIFVFSIIFLMIYSFVLFMVFTNDMYWD